jgi:hypothetical protein
MPDLPRLQPSGRKARVGGQGDRQLYVSGLARSRAEHSDQRGIVSNGAVEIGGERGGRLKRGQPRVLIGGRPNSRLPPEVSRGIEHQLLDVLSDLLATVWGQTVCPVGVGL